MNKPSRTIITTISSALVVMVSCVVYFSSTSVAANVNDWISGNITDDITFTDTNSMSVQQIQSFLDSKIGVCDTWGTGPSEYGGGTRAQYAASQGWPGPPYTCLNIYYEVPKTAPSPAIPVNNYSNPSSIPSGAQSAAWIIKDAAVRYNISPKVLLVKVGTESAGPLTSDKWPLFSQYRYAMGAHCPDSGPGGSANCDSNYSGFSMQMYEAAKLLRSYLDNMDQPWWGCVENGVKVQCPSNRQGGSDAGGGYKVPGATNYILWNVRPSGCGGQNIYIENKATAALYTYTPYQPNQAALNNLYGTGNSCSAYGNRNFWRVFSDWFGYTRTFVYIGTDYSHVFDPTYYLANNPDLRDAFGDSQLAAFNHFINVGIYEGRQGNASFNITSYKTRYEDLRTAFGSDPHKYVWHYVVTGKKEGRIATGDYRGGTSVYGGVDYSKVYGFDYYTRAYPDLWTAYGLDDKRALWHFLNVGVSEGRQASANFSITSYKNRYPDLRSAFGNNLSMYLWHYIVQGQREGRIATGDTFVGTTVYNGVDYGPVYNFDYYQTNNPDIRVAYGRDDTKTLWHFLNVGVSEGRQASANFNITSYKNRYPDLRSAFGNNLSMYLWHYIVQGQREGRIATDS